MLDYYLFKIVWKWAKRRHNNISTNELKEKYFLSLGEKKLVFGCIQEKSNSILRLQRHTDIKFS
jgi:hypothetical protein